MSAIMEQIKKVKSFAWFLYPLVYSNQTKDTFDYDTNLLSPFREENTPSFKVWSNSYRFEDFKLNGYKGDIIDFYQLITGCNNIVAVHTLYQILLTGVYKEINPSILQKESGKDFSLKVWHKPEIDRATELYYKTWDISVDTLNEYDLKSVKGYEINYSYFKATKLTIDMPILNHSKLLQPYSEPQYKWCSTYKNHFVEGFLQAKNRNFNKDVAIISKATKENMFYAQHYQVDSFSAPSECILLSEEVIKALKQRYKKVIVALDNDKTGKETSYAYKLKYDLDFIFYPAKNITDHYEVHKDLSIFYKLTAPLISKI